MTEAITYRIPIVRLVGIWRFLTPMDRLQENDYGRVRTAFGAYQEQWVPVQASAWWHPLSLQDTQVCNLPNVEFVRGVPNESSVVSGFIDIVRPVEDRALAGYIEQVSKQYYREPFSEGTKWIVE